MWNRTLNGENNHSVNVPLGRFNWLFMDYGNLKVTPPDPHWRASKMHRKFPFKSFGIEMHLQKCSKKNLICDFFCLYSIKAREIFKVPQIGQFNISMKITYSTGKGKKLHLIIPISIEGGSWLTEITWDIDSLEKRNIWKFLRKYLFSILSDTSHPLHHWQK